VIVRAQRIIRFDETWSLSEEKMWGMGCVTTVGRSGKYSRAPCPPISVFKVPSIRTAHFCPEKSDLSMVFSGRSLDLARVRFTWATWYLP